MNSFFIMLLSVTNGIIDLPIKIEHENRKYVYAVEVTTNLVKWTEIESILLEDGKTLIANYNKTNLGLYRIRIIR